MKRIFQLCFSLAFFSLGFSQNLKPIAQKVKDTQSANKMFVKYNLFTVNEAARNQRLYETAAEDVTVMKLNKTEIQRITSEKPDALEMSFPFEGKSITVQLVKNNIFTSDFKVNTDKGYVNYTPGAYYHGIVKGDTESLVAISFFENDVVGVTSIDGVGNIILGKAKNSEDFVSYNDHKLKGSNPFVCGTDDLAENIQNPLPVFDPQTMVAKKKTQNCVRIYYEICNAPYRNNGSNITTTTNWITAIQNNIGTLYQNDRITVALHELFIWTSADPYTGTYSANLAAFRVNRPTFNGDLAHLVNYPTTTSVAYLNSLCGTYRYAYSGIDMSYGNVPTYSWTIMAMTHEMGHALGSQHTHACAWNGNGTQIDGCGPISGNPDPNNGNCAAGPLPTGGGTIMSYCHLVSSVGVNFTKGFGEQPSELIRYTVDSKSCLGTNCITGCTTTVSGLTINEATNNTLTATIVDNAGTSWKYKLAKMDGTVVRSGTTTNKALIFNGLQEATYYTLGVGNSCSGGEAFEAQQLVLTDANWCTGVLFTDPGGENANYGNDQTIVKTFYPANSGDKLKLTFTQFDLLAGDFMNVYNGPNIASPRFTGGTQITGNTIPGPFESTHATGAITVRFSSNTSGSAAGWKSNFQCITLATQEAALGGSVNVSPNPTKGLFTITSKDKIVSYDLYDVTGKIMKKTSKLNSSSERVDLSGNPAGTYVITITTEKETVTRKVIKY